MSLAPILCGSKSFPRGVQRGAFGNGEGDYGSVQSLERKQQSRRVVKKSAKQSTAIWSPLWGETSSPNTNSALSLEISSQLWLLSPFLMVAAVETRVVKRQVWACSDSCEEERRKCSKALSDATLWKDFPSYLSSTLFCIDMCLYYMIFTFVWGRIYTYIIYLGSYYSLLL